MSSATKRIIGILIATILFIWTAILAATFLFEVKTINTFTMAFVVTTILIVTTIFTIKYLSGPIYQITGEMKSLLLGKTYKKIYTKRIDEIGVIANFFNEITTSLERATAEIKERRRLSKELNTAAQIQEDLLPKDKPRIPGLDITVKTRPAAEIGGDSYDFISVEDTSIIYLGDVTGHGIPSGLVMMMVNTLIHSFSSFKLRANEILIRTNKELKPRIKKAMFMTMIMLEWHHEKQEMFYSGAGHEYIIVYRAATGSIEKIPSGGIALGMLPNNSMLTKINPLTLASGDIIVLYSDGLTEGRNTEGTLFGEDRLIETLKNCPQKNSSDVILAHIAETFGQFSQTKEQLDDISLMVIRKQ